MQGRPLNPAHALEFMLAGKATVTLRDVQNQTRFTYKIKTPRNLNPARPVHFVSLLNGPENTRDYVYMGTIFNKSAFRLTQKSRVGPDAPSYQLMNDVFGRLVGGDALPPTIEVWHEGSCGRCGRALTVPESIERGIGPECAGLMRGT